jgi:O-antigen/teichoic acid export membrane protein
MKNTNKDEAIKEVGRQASNIPNLAKGAIINLFGAVSRTVLLFVYTVFLARTLSASDLGIYFLIFTIINIMGVVAIVGLDFGIVRYVALFAGEGKYRLVQKTLSAGLFLGIPISIAVTVAVIGAAPQLSSMVMEGSSVEVTALRIFALSIPFWVLARLLNATTQGINRMQYQVYSRDVGEQLSKIVFSVVAVGLGAGLVGVIWANAASVVLAAAMSLWFVLVALPRVDPAQPSSPSPAARIFRYSYPLAFSNILGIVLAWVDMLLMGYLGTPTDVGYYGAALRVGTGGSVVLVAFATVFTPVISDLYNRNRSSELHTLYKTVGRWIFLCSLPIFLVTATLADPLMNMFGSEFLAGSIALILLALGQLINASTGTAGLMVLMSGRSKMEMVNVSASLVVNVALCFLLIPGLGVVGAAIANATAAGVINLMRAVEVWIFMRMHAYDYNYLKPIFAGVIGSLLVFIEQRFVSTGSNLVAIVIPAAILLTVYVILTVALGLDKNDKAVLQTIKVRLSRTTT